MCGWRVPSPARHPTSERLVQNLAAFNNIRIIYYSYYEFYVPRVPTSPIDTLAHQRNLSRGGSDRRSHTIRAAVSTAKFLFDLCGNIFTKDYELLVV
jgi:hypothetical protein